jgi:hypothetical protein
MVLVVKSQGKYQGSTDDGSLKILSIKTRLLLNYLLLSQE